MNDYFDFMSNFDRTNEVSIDACHNALLYGVIVSCKPERVLELGVGNAYATQCILHALNYNQKGHLTCVDNYRDWTDASPSNRPKDSIFPLIEAMGAKVIAPMTEEEFVKNAPDMEYDLLVSDADHERSGEWIYDTFRIVKDGGILFFHDVFYTESVKKYLDICVEKDLSYFLFNRNSRSDENCELGWLMVKNDREKIFGPAPKIE